MMSDQQQDVEVKIVGFFELASVTCPLALDNYQRSYVWGEEKIIQLLDDLREFLTQQHNQKSNESLTPKHYYMGTLLLHHKSDESTTGEHKENNDEKLFVIDGQQRLTSLSVLYWLLHDELPNHIEFSYRSQRSKVNIQQAKRTMQKVFKAWLEQNPDNNFPLTKDIFNHFRFTAITVKREDLAFTFFDTQNNRGVPLSGTDLLKAFHLRAISNNNLKLAEQLQAHCAQRWEKVQVKGNKKSTNKGAQQKSNDFAPELFHYYLWRGRNWTGRDVVELESRDDILTHFGEQSIDALMGEVALYPAGSNQWGDQLQLNGNNEYQLQASSQHIGQSAAYLPFALRQPVSKGVGFFLYAEKYAAMLNTLLHLPSDDIDINAVQVFYKDVVSKLSAYLQSLYRLALLTYFDRLGSEGIYRFTLWLDYRLGAIRLEKEDIRREAPLKFLREAKRNLLDVISYAYRSEDIITFLQQVDVTKHYESKKGWAAEIKSGNLVQERYVAALAKYYGVTHLNGHAKRIDKKVKLLLTEQGVVNE
jgi:hypothetical protein